MKIWHPEIFQGNMRKKRYFEGWYFKLVDKTETCAVAIIPGVALSASRSHSFIQVLSSHDSTARYFSFPASAFWADQKSFVIQIDQSSFSLNNMRLLVGAGNDEVRADLSFAGVTGWPVRLLSPGAMGWYRFVPFMECYHAVLGFDTALSGGITLNGNTIDMTGGRGYIEKDWGASMPSAWIWMQSNHFAEPGVSLFGSVAKIPWLRSSFTGFIFGVYYKGEVYRFTTYTAARITRLEVTPSHIRLTIEDKKFRLEVEAKREKGADLPAPQLGEMTSKVNESLRSTLDVQLTSKTTGGVIFAGLGRNAGLEFVGDVADMLAGLR